MKLFPILLAGSLLVPSAALAGGNNNGNGCRNRCGDTQVTNNNDYSGNNRNNTYNGGRGGRGGAGGQGGAGGAGGQGGTGVGFGGNSYSEGGRGGSVRNSGNSENTNRNRNSNTQGQAQGQAQGQRQGQGQSQSASSNQGQLQGQSSSNSNSNSNNGNNQSVTIEGDQREVPVAPLLENDSVGTIGDIAVPLPVISATGFASSRPDNTSDYGVTFGIRVPLGTGFFRDAANEERQRRADRGQFRLIQEAVWLRDKGLLNEEAHPRHYAALYGTK